MKIFSVSLRARDISASDEDDADLAADYGSLALLNSWLLNNEKEKQPQVIQ